MATNSPNIRLSPESSLAIGLYCKGLVEIVKTYPARGTQKDGESNLRFCALLCHNRGMKLCGICKIEKPLNEFYTRKKKTCVSHSYCCIECELQKAKNSYKKDKTPYLERTRRARVTMREFIDSHKNKPCAHCKRQYPSFVMDFDHIDPATKSFTIGTWKGQSIQKVAEEIAKCQLLCANCHRIKTHQK